MKLLSEQVLFDRVVVPLERETFSGQMLESAAEMAHCLNTSLVGLYIEDENLTRLANLPIFQEVSAVAPRASNLGSEALARQIRGESLRMQHRFNDIAASRQLRHEFRYRRGQPPAEIQSVLKARDILVTGMRRQSLAATNAHLLSCSAHAALIVPERMVSAEGGAVGVISRHSGSASHILRIAADIASGQRRKLSLFPQQGTMNALLSAKLYELATSLPDLTGSLVREALQSADRWALQPRPALIAVAAEDVTDEEENWVAAGIPLFIFKGAD